MIESQQTNRIWRWRVEGSGESQIGKFGHRVQLLVLAYVKPQENDVVDTEATQATAVVFRPHDLLVRQRTQIINALHGHLAGFGFGLVQGPTREIAASPDHPGSSSTKRGSTIPSFIVAYTRRTIRPMLPASGIAPSRLLIIVGPSASRTAIAL
jgi:hypothetical protein